MGLMGLYFSIREMAARRRTRETEQRRMRASSISWSYSASDNHVRAAVPLCVAGGLPRFFGDSLIWEGVLLFEFDHTFIRTYDSCPPRILQDNRKIPIEWRRKSSPIHHLFATTLARVCHIVFSASTATNQ